MASVRRKEKVADEPDYRENRLTNRLRPSPPEEPESSLQDEALCKGLGRAMLWAERGRLTDESLLIEACLHDRRYDSQLDDARGEWLWQIVESSGAKEKLREPLLDSLRVGLAEEDAKQVCQLALRYALDGDARFANALRNLVAERRFPQCPWVGEEELLRFDGEAGLILAARVRGAAMDEQTGWFGTQLIDAASEQLGEVRVRDVLFGAVETDSAIRRFYEAWREDEGSPAQLGDHRQSYDERMNAITVEEAIAAAESDERAVWLRGWGMHTTETDLRVILTRIWTCREHKVLAKYLSIFSNRPLPDFDQRLLQFIDHSDVEVRRQAVKAVSRNSHAAIRAFIEEVKADRITDEHIELFERNFLPGDEEIIARLIPFGDEHCLHHALFNALDVLENNSAADCTWLGYLAYEATPCGLCRCRAAKLFFGQNCAPEWLIEEARFDSDGETRTLAGGTDDTLTGSAATP